MSFTSGGPLRRRGFLPFGGLSLKSTSGLGVACPVRVSAIVVEGDDEDVLFEFLVFVFSLAIIDKVLFAG